MGQELVFQSSEQRALMEKLDRIAANDAEVMILGPSGVGKELYAEYVHDHSRRSGNPFVAINCANLSIDTLENELFGHAKGAFTGASAATHGIVAAAEGGTLFLDEVDSLSLACQSKLLRFVQQKEYRRLGEVFTRKVGLRLIAACNCDLRRLVAVGRFREDLFFRLHVLPVTISPLKDRPDDVRVLLSYFCKRYAGEYGLPDVVLSDAALAAFERYEWPGNVRELENAVRYLTCLDLGRPAEPADFPFEVTPAPPVRLVLPPETAESQTTFPPLDSAATMAAIGVTDLPLREAKSQIVESFERAYVEVALDRNDGNVSRAARDSGKHRRAFFELMRRYGIDPACFRKR